MSLQLRPPAPGSEIRERDADSCDAGRTRQLATHFPIRIRVFAAILISNDDHHRRAAEDADRDGLRNAPGGLSNT